MIVVLEDGAYRIEWNQAHTFLVYMLDSEREVNVFTTDHSDDITEEQARAEAAAWWAEDGKTDTQLAVRTTFR